MLPQCCCTFGISATLLGAVCLAPHPCSDSTCHCLFSFLLSPSSSLLGSGRGICRAHARLDPSSHSLHHLSVWESCLLGSNPHTPPLPGPLVSNTPRRYVSSEYNPTQGRRKKKKEDSNVSRPQQPFLDAAPYCRWCYTPTPSVKALFS